MILLPVIARELRSASRHPSTFYMRMFSVFALLVASMLVLGQSAGVNLGIELFTYEHLTLLGAIWLLVPFLAADCISRERRDGTLSLLALTPLRPWEVALAKVLAHGLRALTLWLAVLPVLALPLLLGGITGTQLVYAIALHLNSLGLALGCGLLASAMSRRYARAQAAAGVLAATALLGALFALGFLYLSFGPWPVLTASGFSAYEQALFTGVWMAGLSPAGRGGAVAPTNQVLAQVAMAFALLTAVIIFAIIKISAWRIACSWREQGSSVFFGKVHDILCTPRFFTRVLDRWMKHKLNRNPVGWLEQRTWSGRLVMWSWMAMVIGIYAHVLVTDGYLARGLHTFQGFLAALLGASIALTASGSFRRERETGVLELLLVSPIGTGSIIRGRIFGIYSQFGPALILLFSVWLYSLTFAQNPPSNATAQVFGWAVTLACLPPIGLFFSLQNSNSMGAYLRTVFFGMALPFTIYKYSPLQSALEAFLPQLVIAAVAVWQLQHRLAHRKFPMHTSVSS